MKHTLQLSLLLLLLALEGASYLPQAKPVSERIPAKNIVRESTHTRSNPISRQHQENTAKAATLTISGRIFQDGNGMKDGIVNGQPTGTVKGLPPTPPGQIYVVMFHGCKYGCYDSQAVAADGTFSFQVAPNTRYVLYLAGYAGCEGYCILPPDVVQPTGEHIGNGPGSDDKADSQITVEVGTTSVAEVNFAFDHLPLPISVRLEPQPNPLGTRQIIIPTLTGVDREDGYYDGVNGTNAIRLSVPDLYWGTLYYNGSRVTDGQIITNYNPDKLAVDPLDGNVIVQFSFTQIDAAGLEAYTYTPGTVTIPFSDTVTQFDFGDVPSTYHTYLNTGLNVPRANGPRHIIVDGLRIGTLIDAEADGQFINSGYELDYSATGDDRAGQDDDDGIVSFPPLHAVQPSYDLPVTVTNTTGADATLTGWIDFNVDKVLADNERAQVTVPAGATSVTLHWTNIPWTSRTWGDTYARLRLASVASEVATTTGQANSGEVEDYKFFMQEPALPVELTHFEGKWIEGTGNQLRWGTAWEQTNDRFEIQASTNAISFETIGRVAGQGTTTGAQEYAFMDTQPQASITYYRLKQVDINSSFTYSQIIAVKSGLENQEATLVAYPNPTADLLHLQVNKPHVITETNIYSVSGTQVLHQAGSSLSASVGLLPAGLYTVEVITATGQTIYQRFIKQ